MSITNYSVFANRTDSIMKTKQTIEETPAKFILRSVSWPLGGLLCVYIYIACMLHAFSFETCSN